MAEPEHRRLRAALWSLVAAGAFLGLFAWKFLMPRSSRPAPAPAPVMTSAEEYPGRNPTTAFEPSDWSVGPVAVVYAGTLLLLVISAFVLMAAYPNALPDVGRTLRIAPPGPRLQTDTAGDLRRFRAEEDKRLNTYYWIDKQKGTVHIPIEEAMRKLAQTGIAGFPKAQQ